MSNYAPYIQSGQHLKDKQVESRNSNLQYVRNNGLIKLRSDYYGTDSYYYDPHKKLMYKVSNIYAKNDEHIINLNKDIIKSGSCRLKTHPTLSQTFGYFPIILNKLDEQTIKRFILLDSSVINNMLQYYYDPVTKNMYSKEYGSDNYQIDYDRVVAKHNNLDI